nr:unnamed protein product [Digitaria exilis]
MEVFGGEDEMLDAEYAEVDPTGRYMRYNVILGRGAFKTVYKAFDEVEGIEVAWNRISIDEVMQCPDNLDRLYTEVHLLKSLKHGNGVKPAALSKIADPQVKQFIEKCLVPASERSSAKELLQDPFLCPYNTYGPAGTKFSSPSPKSVDISLASLQMDVDTCESSPASSVKENGCVAPVTPHAPVLEFTRTNKNTELKLKGEKLDNNSVSLVLRIADLSGHARNIHFLFYLDSDTAMSVAAEMVEQLELADCDVTFIADFIDLLIVNLVPGWRPVTDAAACSYRHSESEPVITSHQDISELVPDYALVDGMMHAKDGNALSNGHLDSASGAANLGGSQGSEGSVISVQLSGSSKSVSDYGAEDYGTMDCGGYKDGISKLECSHIFGDGSRPIFHIDQASPCLELASSGSSISTADNQDVLNGELVLIEAQYKHLVDELTRMREEAMEGARKKWLPDK